MHDGADACSIQPDDMIQQDPLVPYGEGVTAQGRCPLQAAYVFHNIINDGTGVLPLHVLSCTGLLLLLGACFDERPFLV